MKIGPVVLEKKMFKEIVDGQRTLDARCQTLDDHNSSPFSTLCSGELKMTPKLNQ